MPAAIFYLQGLEGLDCLDDIAGDHQVQMRAAAVLEQRDLVIGPAAGPVRRHQIVKIAPHMAA
ncbi:hypothetical protein, partial [Paracoccus versutus]